LVASKYFRAVDVNEDGSYSSDDNDDVAASNMTQRSQPSTTACKSSTVLLTNLSMQINKSLDACKRLQSHKKTIAAPNCVPIDTFRHNTVLNFRRNVFNQFSDMLLSLKVNGELFRTVDPKRLSPILLFCVMFCRTQCTEFTYLFQTVTRKQAAKQALRQTGSRE